MRAAVFDQYGAPDVIHLREMERPIPKAREVLIKVHAATVSSGDCRIRSLKTPRGFGILTRLVFGLSRPRNPILGTDLAGEVEAVGPDVTQFKKGDRVFALSGMGLGCHAEYKCMREDRAIAHIPPGMSYADAAAIPFGGTTALTFLRDKANLQRGERVLIIGAAGAVGTAAIQLAKDMGGIVTGVCSTANVAFIKSLGADHVVDYTKSDKVEAGEPFDLILDTVGTASYASHKSHMSEKGRLLLIAASLPAMLAIPWQSMTSTKKVMAGTAQEKAEDLRYLAQLAAAGRFKPVISQHYPLERISEAHALVDSGRKRGNVVITFDRS